MYTILTSCYSGNCKEYIYSNIFKKIDTLLYTLSKLEYDNIRFFLNRKRSCSISNIDLFEKLSTYKDILMRKLNNDNCLCDFSTDLIISRINRLLNI